MHTHPEAGGVVLLLPDGTQEALPHLPMEQLFAQCLQGPMHTLTAKQGSRVHYSNTHWEHLPVNDGASMLTGQLIRGDVLLEHRRPQVPFIHPDLAGSWLTAAFLQESPLGTRVQQERVVLGSHTPPPCSASAPSVPEAPSWADLPPGLLSLVALALPDCASALLPLCTVCTSWRAAVVHDHVLLRRTWFNVDPSAARAQPGPTASCSSSNGSGAAMPPTHPQAQLPQSQQQQQRTRFLLGLTGPLRSSLGPEQGPYGGPSSASSVSGPGASHIVQAGSLFPGGASPQLWLGRLPALLVAAARIRNMSAMGVMAQLHEAAGSLAEANRWWQRCAKGGDPDLEGLLKCGLALYQGAPGIEQCADSALLFLSKALKKLLDVSALSQISVDALVRGSLQQLVDAQPAGGPAPPDVADGLAAMEAAGGGDVGAGPAVGPASMHVPVLLAGAPPGQAQALLPMVARAAVVLGYLHLDGEGMREDATEAARLFKLAAACGSREGARVLGWMWNTGQF